MNSVEPISSPPPDTLASWRDAPARWLSAFGSLFEIRRPAALSREGSMVLLAAILVLAAVVRFWGLGSVGLHGDEETMAMPATHILQDGSPELPSGMLYPRAIAQLYLMAASIATFGESEWAMRLPSVLCGLLLVMIAYWAGRRFLEPGWNLAFAAAVALLPAFIVDAQTARMYGFLVTCVAGYVALLFAWERTGRGLYLAAAVAVLILGLQFHTLCVFGAFLAFYPGLVRGDLRKLILGGVAFAVIVAGFFTIDYWIASQYPDATEVAGKSSEIRGPKAASSLPDIAPWLLAVATALAGAVAGFATRSVTPRLVRAGAIALMVIALLAQAAYSYHLAALLLAAGLVLALRFGDRGDFVRFLPLFAVVAGLAAWHIHVLLDSGVALRQVLGALTGRPSIWPLIIAGKYSPVAVLLVGGGIVAGLWRLAQRRPVPDLVLFAVLGVWVPLLVIGVLKWYVPLRYTAAQAFPILLAAFACAQWLMQSLRVSRGGVQVAAALVVLVVVVNPVALARTVNSGYESHPDHKGAAEFIQSLSMKPGDVLVAEDVLQQTYYLGHVDYWLQSRAVAAMFVRNVGGVLEDYYTDTPLIGTGAELEALLSNPRRGAIYVIGSGENQEDGRLHVRGEELSRLLASPQFKVVFVGRDGLTKVLMAPPPVNGPDEEAAAP